MLQLLVSDFRLMSDVPGSSCGPKEGNTNLCELLQPRDWPGVPQLVAATKLLLQPRRQGLGSKQVQLRQLRQGPGFQAWQQGCSGLASKAGSTMPW